MNLLFTNSIYNILFNCENTPILLEGCKVYFNMVLPNICVSFRTEPKSTRKNPAGIRQREEKA